MGTPPPPTPCCGLVKGTGVEDICIHLYCQDSKFELLSCDITKFCTAEQIHCTVCTARRAMQLQCTTAQGIGGPLHTSAPAVHNQASIMRPECARDS